MEITDNPTDIEYDIHSGFKKKLPNLFQRYSSKIKYSSESSLSSSHIFKNLS